MKTIKKSVRNVSLFLQLLYCIFLDLPGKFKDRVCEECGISIPTFYRRLRAENPKCSNADKDKIAQIAIECLEEAILACKEIISRRSSLD